MILTTLNFISSFRIKTTQLVDMNNINEFYVLTPIQSSSFSDQRRSAKTKQQISTALINS
jgi:hypothetical protein